MEYLVNQKMMQTLDQYTIENCGLPGMVLMERAAYACAEELIKRVKPEDGYIDCLCGSGNNGADGIALGRILICRGYRCRILTVGNIEKGSEDFKHQLKVAESFHIPIMAFEENDTSFEGTAVIVDAIFGIGLSREIKGNYRDLIQKVNAYKVKNPATLILAIDIPSGLMADDGKLAGVCIKADLTVTFGFQKLGQLMNPSVCGTLICAEVGFYPQAGEVIHFPAFSYDRKDLKRLPERNPYGHKGSFGKVLVIAGNVDMAGAACFSALACMRSGCGLCKVLTVKENKTVIHSIVPEAILSLYDPYDPDKEEILKDFAWADAIVFGPGIGQKGKVFELLSWLLEWRKEKRRTPLVIDADGLRLLAANKELYENLDENVILTPHMGEMAALSGMGIAELTADPIVAAKGFNASCKGVLVMKNARTLVMREKQPFYVNISGCEALSTAGSGDVLTGVIAALLAVGMDSFEAACLGVFLHGLAGEQAKEKSGNSYSVIARDIIESLASVFALAQRENEF